MWFIYTMKYDSDNKHKDIVNFADKWVELENIILNEVMQAQSDMYGVYIIIEHYPQSSALTILQSTDPKKLSNKEGLGCVILTQKWKQTIHQMWMERGSYVREELRMGLRMGIRRGEGGQERTGSQNGN